MTQFLCVFSAPVTYSATQPKIQTKFYPSPPLSTQQMMAVGHPSFFIRKPVQGLSATYSYYLPPNAECNALEEDEIAGPCYTWDVSCENDDNCSWGKKCCETPTCGKRCNYKYKTAITTTTTTTAAPASTTTTTTTTAATTPTTTTTTAGSSSTTSSTTTSSSTTSSSTTSSSTTSSSTTTTSSSTNFHCSRIFTVPFTTFYWPETRSCVELSSRIPSV